MKQNTTVAAPPNQNAARCPTSLAAFQNVVPLSRALLSRPVKLVSLSLPEGAEALSRRLSDLGFLPGVVLVPLGWVGKGSGVRGTSRRASGQKTARISKRRSRHAPVLLRLRGYTAVVSPALAERMLVTLS